MIGRDGRFLGPAKELECADDEEIVAKAMRMGSGILTFGVLPHHPEIDVTGRAIG
jgi:phage tail sheath protein FI